MLRVAVAVLMAILLPLGPSRAQTANPDGDTSASVNLFGSAFERIRRDAVDAVGDGKLVGAAIAGMLSGLDPRAAYLDAAALQAQQGAAAAGAAEGGVGLVVTMDHGTVKVISPQDGSPAAKAGLKPGDVIYAIDREPTYDLDLSRVEEKLRGAPGSEVKLLLRRGEGGPSRLTVKREAWRLESVSGRLDHGDIGYVRLAGFAADTAAALERVAAALKQQSGGKLIGLVIDLRNNPGGALQAAVDSAARFLDKGEVAVLKGRQAADVKRLTATPQNVAKGLPLVVLVNGGTAREAELFAGALQDNRRAVLLGTKTYGESAIESVIPLKSGGAIRLTTARFETPNGHQIQGKGLEPDLSVVPLKLERFAEGDIQREADLPGALKNPTAKPPANAPPGATPAPEAAAKQAPSLATQDIGAKDDEQLNEAEDVLRGAARFGRGSG
jgi:carboxyl-terminal processing protease